MRRLLPAARSLAAIALTLAAMNTPAEGPPVLVEDAWVRAAPPSAEMLAGFMTLTNRSDRIHVLVGADSPDFREVSIHRTRIEDGMARMRPVEGVELLPGESVVFEPGGLHLMLVGPERPLSPDDEVRLVLHLEDGSQLVTTAVVRHPAGDRP